MEFYRPDLVEKYAHIIDAVDLKAIHEARYSWSVSTQLIREVAPDITQPELNELNPVITGLAFERHGHPGGIHACITG